MDKLQLYFGDDVTINDHIQLHQPTLNDVIQLGEENYFSMVHTLTMVPSDMKPFLFDELHVYWEDVDEFELFLQILLPQTDPKNLKIFFPDIDFEQFHIGHNTQSDEPILIQPDKHIILDRLAYIKIMDVLRTIHNIVPVRHKAATKTVRDILIDDDRRIQKRNKTEYEKNGYSSTLFPLVSTLVNCADCKYGLQEIRSMPIFAFMDAISRIQVIRNTTALLHGCYSGMIDTSKIKKEELNFMREIKFKKS